MKNGTKSLRTAVHLIKSSKGKGGFIKISNYEK